MADTNIKKNQTATVQTKSGGKYSYQYVDIAQIHDYLEENNMSYYQYIDRIDDDDYVMTVKIIDGEPQAPLRGCRVVDATLFGTDNPAQKQGSALTYARRYSLLMAFGLATEDDDAASLNQGKPEKPIAAKPQASTQPNVNLITTAQAKRLYAIGKGNVDLIKEVIGQFGYSESKQIKMNDYENICKILEIKVGGN